MSIPAPHFVLAYTDDQGGDSFPCDTREEVLAALEKGTTTFEAREGAVLEARAGDDVIGRYEARGGTWVGVDCSSKPPS